MAEIDWLEENKVETTVTGADGVTRKSMVSMQHPLHFTGYVHPVQIVTSRVIRKKAALLFYMLHRRLGGEAFFRLLGTILSSCAPATVNRSVPSVSSSSSDPSSAEHAGENGSAESSSAAVNSSSQQSSSDPDTQSSMATTTTTTARPSSPVITDAPSGKNKQRHAVSTRFFLKLMKKTAFGPDLKLFERQWM